MPNRIYTIGHSNHEIEYFIELIEAFAVNCIVDVRSTAASAYNPQFNKEILTYSLKKHGITYLHFAEEFGARHTDPNLLDQEGKVDFGKVKSSEQFKKGVIRLGKGIENNYTIALMCSESDPFDCHRFSMISVALEKDDFETIHILKDKSTLTNTQLEAQLLKKYSKKIPVSSIFTPNVTLEDQRQEQIEAAYKFRNQDIAFSPYSKTPFEEDD